VLNLIIFQRLNKRKYKSDAAFHYMDLLNYLDGMRAQAFNIAEITTGTKFNIGLENKRISRGLLLCEVASLRSTRNTDEHEKKGEILLTFTDY